MRVMYYFVQSRLLLRGISAYADPNGCQPISGDAAARLTEYIQKRFKFPPKISFEISSSELIGQTCFRRSTFVRKIPIRESIGSQAERLEGVLPQCFTRMDRWNSFRRPCHM